ncbi:MAG: BON domain-containing protein, partial [Rickettsiales bacterium]|nr:BON domain-containing protein [Rickettsiales bacterium]
TPVMISGATSTAYAVAQERTIGNAIDDATISAHINSAFIQKDLNELFQRVDVTVQEGKVLLTGAVRKPETRVEAAKLAWKAPGVRAVINEIQVTDKSSVVDYAKDVFITAQVKSRLALAKHLRSINYTVETVNGVVYLLGITKDRAELQEVADIASRVKGVQRVVSHMRTYYMERTDR